MGFFRSLACFLPHPRSVVRHPLPLAGSSMAPQTRSHSKSQPAQLPNPVPAQLASAPIAHVDASPAHLSFAGSGSAQLSLDHGIEMGAPLGPTQSAQFSAPFPKANPVKQSNDLASAKGRTLAAGPVALSGCRGSNQPCSQSCAPSLMKLVAKSKRKGNAEPRKERIGTRSSKRLKDAVEQKVEPGGTEMFAATTACGICKATNPLNLFRMTCRHEFCLHCIQEDVVKAIRDQLETSNPSFTNITTHLKCPDPRCTWELGRTELVHLLGLNVVRYYERWLAETYDAVYRPSLNKDSRVACLSCKNDELTPTAVLAEKISDLSHEEVCNALEVRGFGKKFLKQHCVKLLLNAVGVDENCNDVTCWICTACDAAWCGACGANLPILRQKNYQEQMHKLCKEQQNYEIYKNIIDLGVAWRSYTMGSVPRELKHSSGNSKKDTIWAEGTGFGGKSTLNQKHLDAAKAVELEVDGRVEKALGCLIELLDRRITLEKDQSCPEQSLAAFALLSSGNILNQLLKQLVMNDSILDISSRSSLYLKLVAFLKALRPHTKLLPMLIGCENKQDQTVKGEDWIMQFVGMKKEKGKDKTIEEEVEENNSVIKMMENIYKQAKIMLQRLQGEARGKMQHADIILAKELCECYELLLQSLPQHQNLKDDHQITSPGGCTRLKKMLDAEDKDLQLRQSIAVYKEKLKPLQFKVVNMIDEKGAYLHYFKDYIMGKSAKCIDKQGVHNQKRMLRISKEIASMSTSLPLEWESSIYLCVDEARMDVLRTIIIGPCGTPYQNGIFSFDIFLPPDYPQVPPYVQFLTTGGGVVRFNPNLYSSGKVCLSLLGTWSGPGWIPGKSTLLQVLVSIQSLIFVKDPYYNEPGFEQSESPKAEQENALHRENTLSTAVLGALRKPDPLFEDVIRQHFSLKKEELEQQCEEWVAAANNTYSKQRMENTVKEIKAELERF